MKIYRAYYDSRSFTFEAYGSTEIEAIDALVIGLLQHTKQYNCDPDWFDIDEISVKSYFMGFGYRDYEMISKAK